MVFSGNTAGVSSTEESRVRDVIPSALGECSSCTIEQTWNRIS